MPDAPTLLPSLHLGATSYEASAGGVEVRTAQWREASGVPEPRDPVLLDQLDDLTAQAAGVLAPPLPALPTAPVESVVETPRVRRSSRRVRDLMLQLAARRNELMELLRGPFAGSGWGTSLLLHAAVMTALAFLVISPDRPDPPRILTVGTDLEGPAGVGDSTEDVELSLPAATSVESDPTLAALGGSTGESELDVSSLAGNVPAGRGRGTGGGAGDAIGADIAGRVKAAGGKGGSLQLSLGWNDRNDLDLHVVTPGGERIYYARIQSADGGRLDVDMNINGESKQPVENITWGGNTPRDGRYLVQVHYFKSFNRNEASPFYVRLQLGDDVQVIPAVAKGPQQFTQVATFDVQDGRCVAVSSQVSGAAVVDIPATAADSKRLENRENSAREMLTEAETTTDLRLRAGKLRTLIRRFGGTEAAAEAQRQLDELPQ